MLVVGHPRIECVAWKRRGGDGGGGTLVGGEGGLGGAADLAKKVGEEETDSEEAGKYLAVEPRRAAERVGVGQGA